MGHCSVKGCKYSRNQKNGKQYKLFRFPKEEPYKSEWLKVCNPNINTMHARICSRHFEEQYYFKPLMQQMLVYSPVRHRKIKADAVPTLYLANNSDVLDSHVNAETIMEVDEDLLNNAGECSAITTIMEVDEDLLNNAGECSAITNIPESVSEKGICSEQERDDDALQCRDAGIDVNLLSEKIVEMSQKIENLQRDVGFYKKRCSKLQAALTRANRQKAMINQTEIKAKAVHYLERVFTPGQIKMLLNPVISKTLWSPEDISSAIALRCISPKGYRYIRQVSKFPLPSISTLRRWAQTLKFETGTLDEVIQIMHLKSPTLTSMEKLVSLSFDDIYVSNKVEIDRKQEKVIGPHKTCLCVMARGLLSKWKQPVYYDFDLPMSKNIFDDIVIKLHNAGYTVVTVTCDMGPSNDKFLSEMGIGAKLEMNTIFPNPADPLKSIFYFPDVPHLLKLLRNHFIDSGFHFEIVHVTSMCVQNLMKFEKSDLKISWKLTPLHLSCQGTERQKVKLAAQLFSTTVAKAISYCGDLQAEGFDNWEKTEYVILLINDWFDVFNSRYKYGKTECQHAFGVSLKQQTQKLDEMSKFMYRMAIGSHKYMLKCQKGVIMANNSLKCLLPYLQATYNTLNIQYINTYKLNQDVLENFFARLRCMGSGFDRLTPLEVKHRLRLCVLAKSGQEAFSEASNSRRESGCNLLMDMSDYCHTDVTLDISEGLVEELNVMPTAKLLEIRDSQFIASMDEPRVICTDIFNKILQ